MQSRPIDARVLATVMAEHRESTLERAQSDMNRFFELSLDMFCLADQDGYFVRINSNFSKVLGHSERYLLSEPFLSFVHEDDRAKTIEVVAALHKGEPVVRFQNRYRTSSGEYITLEWTAKASPDNKIIFGVARNVSTIH